jgi:hypothetical protein
MRPQKAQVKDKGLEAESGDLRGVLEKSGPRRARTVDPRIKSPLLYRLSYRPHLLRSLDQAPDLSWCQARTK